MTKIWQWVSAGMGALALFFAAMAYRTEAKANKRETEHQKLLREQEREARELTENASAVMVNGLEAEREILEDDTTPIDRRHFE